MNYRLALNLILFATLTFLHRIKYSKWYNMARKPCETSGLVLRGHLIDSILF